jgi:hypothetical protein
MTPSGLTARSQVGRLDEQADLSPIERALVAAVVSAIVKELRAAQAPPVRPPAA